MTNDSQMTPNPKNGQMTRSFPNTRPIQFWSFGFLIRSWVDKHWLIESCNLISDPIFANKKKVVFFLSLFLCVFKRSKFSITLFIWHFKAGYFFKVLLLQRKNICNIGLIKNHNQMYSILMLITCCDQKSERSEMNRPNKNFFVKIFLITIFGIDTCE